jgi:hypothetical protein
MKFGLGEHSEAELFSNALDYGYSEALVELNLAMLNGETSRMQKCSMKGSVQLEFLKLLKL